MRDANPRLAPTNSPLRRSHFVLVSLLRSPAQVHFMSKIGTLQWLTVCQAKRGGHQNVAMADRERHKKWGVGSR